jgi:hypothetical protein
LGIIAFGVLSITTIVYGGYQYIKRFPLTGLSNQAMLTNTASTPLYNLN